MKKLSYLLLSAVFALTACSSGNSSQEAPAAGAANADQTYTIVAGHAASPDHFAHKSFEKFKEIVEKNSQGKIKVEIHPSGQLGGEREMIEGLQLGNLTMAAPASAPLAAFSPSMSLWDLPYLFLNHEMAHSVLDGEIGQQALADLEAKGIKGLAYWENGFRHLTNNRGPVTKPEDLSGLKMRVLENPVHIEAWKAVGANSTPLAFTELYAALQQKTVDAQETPLSLIYAQKFYEVQQYLSLTKHVYSPWPVIMNKNFYDSLPADLQKVVSDAAIEVRSYNRQISLEDEKAALGKLQEAGMKVNELSEEELAQFKEKMLPVYDIVKDKIGAELVDKVLEATSK